MTKKQKKVLIRIIVAAILLVILHFVPLEGLWLGLLYLIPYAVIGYDILRKSVLGIMHGEVFDENFLMAVATVGAGRVFRGRGSYAVLPDRRTVPGGSCGQEPSEYQCPDGYPSRLC